MSKTLEPKIGGRRTPHVASAAIAAPSRAASHHMKSEKAAENSNRFLKNTLVAPRVAALASRFPGNVHHDLLDALLGFLWTSLLGAPERSCSH